MKLLTRILALSLLAVCVVPGAHGQASVLFSNFGPNDSYLPYADTALVWQNTLGGRVEHASQFTVPGAFPWTFDSVEVPFSSQSSDLPGVDLWLMSDVNGSPGTILETMTLGSVTTTPTIYNVSSTQNTVLFPGQSYWIGATPTSVSVQGADWHDNPLGQQGGRALRLPNSNFGWILNPDRQPNPTIRINGTPEIPNCVIGNPSFETLEPTSGGLPIVINDWKGEFSEIVTGTTLGITPHSGQRMLQFNGTTFVGGDQSQVDSSMFQLVDVGHLKAQIDAGLVEFDFEYLANRVAGDSQTDTQFVAAVRAYDGDPIDFPSDFINFLDVVESDLFSDGDPNSWESVNASMTLPAGTDYVAVTMVALENVFNDTKGEFDGHFADNACVRLNVIPEPSSMVPLTLAGVALIAVRRRQA